MEEFEFTKENFLKGIEKACYNGERSVFQIGGASAVLVPCEDLEILEELEKFEEVEV